MTHWISPPAALIVGELLFSSLNAMIPSPSSAIPPAPLVLAQQRGNSSSSHVGAAMTVLATLDQARVLPPEGTKEADRVIQSVIQLQSLFMTSPHPAVRDFLQRAVERFGGEHAAITVAEFRSSGWTSGILDALAHAAQAATPEELQALEEGLRSVNLSMEDFRRFMRLVTDGEQELAATGRNFHDVFAFHRQSMPGAAAR